MSNTDGSGISDRENERFTVGCPLVSPADAIAVSLTPDATTKPTLDAARVRSTATCDCCSAGEHANAAAAGELGSSRATHDGVDGIDELVDDTLDPLASEEEVLGSGIRRYANPCGTSENCALAGADNSVGNGALAAGPVNSGARD